MTSETTINVLPASFWQSHGFSEKDAKGMLVLQEKLISGSSSVSMPPYEFEGALRYHELALPYWKAFANTPGQLDKFTVKNVQLPPVLWQTITPKINGIKSLTLEDNNLSTEGFFSLAQFLSNNTSLEELSFNSNSSSGNDLTDLQAAKALGQAMKGHPTLQKVNAIWMEIGGNYHLDKPTPDIAKAFIDGCENCVEVNISQCGMDDDCAPAYGAMVKRNKKLTQLFIFWESFTSKGVEMISKGVYDTTTLNDIVDSNHNCVIYTSEMQSDDPNRDLATKMTYVNGMDCSDTLKIRYKVQRALFGVGSEPQFIGAGDGRVIVAEEGKELDLTYFRDVPLELAPHVLEFMLKQRMVVEHEFDDERYYIKGSSFVYYDEKKREYLNRIYQALKGWVVPLLFGDSHLPGGQTKRKAMSDLKSAEKR